MLYSVSLCIPSGCQLTVAGAASVCVGFPHNGGILLSVGLDVSVKRIPYGLLEQLPSQDMAELSALVRLHAMAAVDRVLCRMH